MRDDGIGRVLVASLHQAISDLLPTRLAFYESWLNAEGMRGGTIGLAPLYAVLSFLRQEGDAYDRVMVRAGKLAAEWTVQGVSPLERAVIDRAPAWLRLRLILNIAGNLVRSTYLNSRATSSMRRGVAHIAVQASIFCSVRAPADHPLCGFYAAAFERMLALFEVNAHASVLNCRGTTCDASACVVALVIDGRSEVTAA